MSKPNYRDKYGTPRHIVWEIESALNVRVAHDVCASEHNTVAASFWSEETDALSFSWADRLRPMTVCWMNPPYSALPAWTAKAAEESRKGLLVVGLVPDMRSSKWFQRNVEGVASLCLLPDGRINFDPPPEALADPEFKQSSNPWPSCVPVWTPWRTGQTQYLRFDRRS